MKTTICLLRKSRLFYKILIVFLFFSFYTSSAQNSTPDKDDEPKVLRRKKNFLPLPFVNYGRNRGFSGQLLPMTMYHISKKDTISPASISGMFIMYSNNLVSLVQFNRFYFDEDRYRVILVFGVGNGSSQVNAYLPSFEGTVDLATDMKIFKIEAQRHIVRNLYFGLNYTHTYLHGKDQTEGIDFEKTVIWDGIGAITSFDSRSNVYYPKSGFFSNINYSAYPEFMGNEYVSHKMTMDYNHFFALRRHKDVVGLRIFGGVALGNLTTNQKFVVGNNDIRGYTSRKYKGDQILALQGEYRWNPIGRLGFVGFAGVASVFSATNPAYTAKSLPAVGSGIRFNIFPKNHLNISIDAAKGIDDYGFYFMVGEAF